MWAWRGAGHFDDAQTGVKRLFSDEKLRQTLAEKGYFFSSANSINWGRVLPQIVYYVSSYCDLLASGAIKEGQTVNVCVPTATSATSSPPTSPSGWDCRSTGLFAPRTATTS